MTHSTHTPSPATPWWGLWRDVTPLFGARLVQEGHNLHFLADRAGVELPQEDTEFSFPDGIRVLREVTENRLLSNAALARHIPPQEELLRMP